MRPFLPKTAVELRFCLVKGNVSILREPFCLALSCLLACPIRVCSPISQPALLTQNRPLWRFLGPPGPQPYPTSDRPILEPHFPTMLSLSSQLAQSVRRG